MTGFSDGKCSVFNAMKNGIFALNRTPKVELVQICSINAFLPVNDMLVNLHLFRSILARIKSYRCQNTARNNSIHEDIND